MLTPIDIEQKIAAALPGASVKVTDPFHDGVHLAASVVAPQFIGKSKVAQHQLVYAALGDVFDTGTLHALQLSTMPPEEVVLHP